MVEIPDGVLGMAIGLLAATLGFLARSVFDLRGRLAVVEAREAARDDKLDDLKKGLLTIDKKLDDLALDVARGNSLNNGGGIQ